MAQVLGAALTEEKDVASGHDSVRVLQSEITLLKRYLALIQEVDDEELERLYSRMGIILPIYPRGTSKKKEGQQLCCHPLVYCASPILMCSWELNPCPCFLAKYVPPVIGRIAS